MWLWVGVLAIHSKKRSGNSFPWDELFWTWKWAKRLGSDFWPFGWMMPKLPSAHCNSYNICSTACVLRLEAVKYCYWAWEIPGNARFGWRKLDRYSHTACHLKDPLTEGLLNVNIWLIAVKTILQAWVIHVSQGYRHCRRKCLDRYCSKISSALENSGHKVKPVNI